VALWLINRFIPMARSIKSILNVVVVVAVCVLGIAGDKTLGAALQLGLQLSTSSLNFLVELPR